MSKFKRFLTKKYILWTIAAIAVVFLGFTVFGNGNGGAEVITVKKQNVVQEVVVTGKAVARSEVSLGFDTSGRVARVSASVGQRVSQGSVIAELDVSEAAANLAKERASLAEEEANQSSESQSLASSIREAYSAADNAVRNKTDQFFKQPLTNPSFEVKFSDGNFVHYFNVPAEVTLDLNNTRRNIETILTLWQSELPKVNSGNAEQYSEINLDRLNSISGFLDKVAYAVNSFTPAEYAYESTVTGYKTAVDSARSTVVTARKNLITAKGDISSGQGVSVTAGQAKISQIKASIASLEASLRKSRIVAPFDGTITTMDAKVGQVAVSGNSLIAMISEGDMYIEANVSEVNIGKVAPTNLVRVEFDALPNEIFDGIVTFVDPGETIIDEVVNYKIRVELQTIDPRIKSGLTANIRIAAREVKDALSIPVYAITKEGDKYFVNKLVNNKSEKIEIQKGLQGSDGVVEITAGLYEGDRIEIPK